MSSLRFTTARPVLFILAFCRAENQHYSSLTEEGLSPSEGFSCHKITGRTTRFESLFVQSMLPGSPGWPPSFDRPVLVADRRSWSLLRVWEPTQILRSQNFRRLPPFPPSAYFLVARPVTFDPHSMYGVASDGVGSGYSRKRRGHHQHKLGSWSTPGINQNRRTDGESAAVSRDGAVPMSGRKPNSARPELCIF